MSQEKKNILLYSFSGVLLLSLMTFSNVKHGNRKVEGIEIAIEEQEGIYFTDQMEVMDLVTLSQTDFVVGSELEDLKPKALEERVEANPFIKDAQVYRDIKGNVKVRVKQSKPIARVLMEGEDRYIDTEGNILPVNARHTARVPLLETAFDFKWETSLHESDYGTEIFNLISFIEDSEFWKAQIAQILLTMNGEVELLPQVTKQKIEFGQPEQVEEKFEKLMIFYKEILPKKGWNTYSQVSLKFENQIVCK